MKNLSKTLAQNEHVSQQPEFSSANLIIVKIGAGNEHGVKTLILVFFALPRNSAKNAPLQVTTEAVNVL